MDALLKQIDAISLDDVDVNQRVDRALVEKKVAEKFQAKGISYKKGSDRFTLEHWKELDELAQKHNKLSPGEDVFDVVKPFFDKNGYSLLDVKQTAKANKADLPLGYKGDMRTWRGVVLALLAIASNKTSAGSSAAVAGKDHGTELMSELAPPSPTPASAKSAQPASSGDSAQTGDAEGSEDSTEESDSEDEDIEVIERPMTTDEMLQKLKVRGVVHGQDPKKVARVVDIEKALKVQKVEFDPKLKKEEKTRLLYDAMCSV